MAVTLTVAQLAARLRVDQADQEPQLGILTELLAVATELVQKEAPNAPEALQNAAAARVAGYLYDSPNSAAGASYAAALHNSGAHALLSRWAGRRSALGNPDEQVSEPGTAPSFDDYRTAADQDVIDEAQDTEIIAVRTVAAANATAIANLGNGNGLDEAQVDARIQLAVPLPTQTEAQTTATTGTLINKRFGWSIVRLRNWLLTQLPTVLLSDAQAGTSTARRIFTAQRVRQAIAHYTLPFTQTEKTRLGNMDDEASKVVANPAGTDGAMLTRLEISGTNYNLGSAPASGGTATITYGKAASATAAISNSATLELTEGVASAITLPSAADGEFWVIEVPTNWDLTGLVQESLGVDVAAAWTSAAIATGTRYSLGPLNATAAQRHDVTIEQGGGI